MPLPSLSNLQTYSLLPTYRTVVKTAVKMLSKINTQSTEPGMKVNSPMPRSTQTSTVIDNTARNATMLGLSDRPIAV
ncbi:hypothetical protein [Stenomitos frigidus]|uniref:hypothetical protein n=1 Tax=Stenomitos frigidus TaxID=1886765 RepID=UPI0015E67FB8|nr:hypothetical protein [Stenomitos frigidus]